MKYKAGDRVENINGIYDDFHSIDAGTPGTVQSDSRVSAKGRWDSDDVFRYYDTERASVLFEVSRESHQMAICDVDELRETRETPNDPKLSDRSPEARS